LVIWTPENSRYANRVGVGIMSQYQLWVLYYTRIYRHCHFARTLSNLSFVIWWNERCKSVWCSCLASVWNFGWNLWPDLIGDITSITLNVNLLNQNRPHTSLNSPHIIDLVKVRFSNRR